MMALLANVRRALCVVQIELPLAEVALALGLMALDVVARVTPHAPNFTPVAASALFAGAVLRSRTLALAVPLAAMVVSDLVLGWHDWRDTAAADAGLEPSVLLRIWGRARAPSLLLPLVPSLTLVFL